MYLSYEQVGAVAVVRTVADLTVPANATHAELQATVAGVAYTMDDATDPTVASGMVLLATEPPKSFLIEDIRRIRFICFDALNANLNIHYFAGRDI